MDAEFLEKATHFIFVIVPQIIAAASIISAITPTKKDDQVINFIVNTIRILGVNIGKAKPEE